MKITNEELKQIIKEELEKVLEEGIPSLGLGYMMAKAAKNIQNRGGLSRTRSGSDDSSDSGYRGYRPDSNSEYIPEYDPEFEKMKREQERIRLSDLARRMAKRFTERGFKVSADKEYLTFHGIKGGYDRFTGKKIKNFKVPVSAIAHDDNEAAEMIMINLRRFIEQNDPDYLRRASRRRMSQGKEKIRIDDPMMERKQRK
jgi:hypothetical protein